MRFPFLSIVLMLVIALSPARSGLPGAPQAKNKPQTMAQLNEEIAKHPDNFEALVDRALLRGSDPTDRRFADWESAMKHALELDPKNPMLYVERSIRGYEDPRAQLADCEFALFLDPKCVVAYARRAEIHWGSDKYKEALKDWNRAIDLSPKNAKLYNLRAGTREDSGDFTGALADYDSSIELNPKFVESFTSRADVKRKLGDLGAAMTDYAQAFALEPDDVFNEIRLGRGTTFYIRQEYEAAFREFNAVAPPFLMDGYELFYACVAEMRCGQVDAARATLGKRLNDGTGVPDEYWGRLVAAFLLGDVDEAKFLAGTTNGKADKLKDRQCEAWFYAGIVKLAAGKKEESIERFRKCVETGAEHNYEFEFAKADLKALGAK